MAASRAAAAHMDVFSAEYRRQRLRKVGLCGSGSSCTRHRQRDDVAEDNASASAVLVWLWLWWHCDGGFRCLGSSAYDGIDDMFDIAIVLNLDDMLNAA